MLPYLWETPTLDLPQMALPSLQFYLAVTPNIQYFPYKSRQTNTWILAITLKLHRPGHSIPPPSRCGISYWSEAKVQDFLTHVYPWPSLFQNVVTRAKTALETSQQIPAEEATNLQFENHQIRLKVQSILFSYIHENKTFSLVLLLIVLTFLTITQQQRGLPKCKWAPEVFQIIYFGVNRSLPWSKMSLFSCDSVKCVLPKVHPGKKREMALMLSLVSNFWTSFTRGGI